MRKVVAQSASVLFLAVTLPVLVHALRSIPEDAFYLLQGGRLAVLVWAALSFLSVPALIAFLILDDDAQVMRSRAPRVITLWLACGIGPLVAVLSVDVFFLQRFGPIVARVALVFSIAYGTIGFAVVVEKFIRPSWEHHHVGERIMQPLQPVIRTGGSILSGAYKLLAAGQIRLVAYLEERVKTVEGVVAEFEAKLASEVAETKVTTDEALKELGNSPQGTSHVTLLRPQLDSCLGTYEKDLETTLKNYRAVLEMLNQRLARARKELAIALGEGT
ncbi:hypothetical protein FVE85_5494 [Porphyridium purpureum]|uniref:Uncharacterized protein n=1 Tax=Porphyridium purpureum TaxID=35688 RepID=A0A5J4Z1X1_PORPP|nr:hypothetical protein FVE85_5494 [Porphyridium purpureum]|eukprot:POR6241..scf295_1